MTGDTLEGMTVLVTGSSRNLGAAIAREFAQRGSTVVITYRESQQEAAALAARLEETTGRAHPTLFADLSSGSTTNEFLSRYVDDIGPTDVLVNNAGPFAMDPFEDLPEPDWNRIFDSNVKAAHLCAQALIPGMRQLGRGRIVNISAGSAYLRNHSIYTLAKAALITLTEALALELGPEITVNAVAPGQIAESADDIAEFDPTFVERVLTRTPIGRLVTRAEIAWVVAELCSPRFDGVTGVTLPIDGGARLNRF